jgi:hypothetical protein
MSDVNGGPVPGGSDKNPYVLEVHLCGETVYRVESKFPFLAFGKGDLINPRTWPEHCYQPAEGYASPHGKPRHGVVLRVLGVEHFVVSVERGPCRVHGVRVFVEALDDVGGSRPVPPVLTVEPQVGPGPTG